MLWTFENGRVCVERHLQGPLSDHSPDGNYSRLYSDLALAGSIAMEL